MFSNHLRESGSLPLSFARAFVVDAGLVLVQNLVHACQVVVETGLDVVVHVALFHALNFMVI